MLIGIPFQLEIVANRVYQPENGGISTTILIFGSFCLDVPLSLLLTCSSELFGEHHIPRTELLTQVHSTGYAQALLLLFYIFGLFWFIRRPNALVVHGILIGVCTIVLVITVLISAVSHPTPWGDPAMIRRLNLFFGFKTFFCLVAQIAICFIVWTNVYTFRRLFGRVGSYSKLYEDPLVTMDQGSYRPPPFTEASPPTELPTIDSKSSTTFESMDTSMDSTMYATAMAAPSLDE